MPAQQGDFRTVRRIGWLQAVMGESDRAAAIESHCDRFAVSIAESPRKGQGGAIRREGRGNVDKTISPWGQLTRLAHINIHEPGRIAFVDLIFTSVVILAPPLALLGEGQRAAIGCEDRGNATLRPRNGPETTAIGSQDEDLRQWPDTVFSPLLTHHSGKCQLAAVRRPRRLDEWVRQRPLMLSGCSKSLSFRSAWVGAEQFEGRRAEAQLEHRESRPSGYSSISATGNQRQQQ